MKTYGTARETATPASSPMISGIRHDVPEAAAQWLDPIEWKLFCTLEFPGTTRTETAVAKFSELVNDLERTLHTPLCFVNALESRSKSGGNVPNHYHVAFTAARPIPIEMISCTWSSIIGRDPRSGGDLALVQPYDRLRNGVGYITKMAADNSCEWSFKNLHRFNPAIVVAPKTDRKSRREAKRFAAQVSAERAPCQA